MSLPINISALLSGNIVEGERIEFKEGWNPSAVMRTVCAFANDFYNLGSGYIVIGVEEKNGRPTRPVKGFPPSDFERIGKEMLGYSNLMRPSYFPRLYLEEIDGKHVLVIWVPAGSNRPYEVPKEIKSKHKEYEYYIRQYSNSVIPSKIQRTELIQLTAQIPFDDRVNVRAKVSDLSKSLMQEHLQKTNNKLYEESRNQDLDTTSLARQMNLVEGAEEHLFPKNIGLLMFSENPQQYFKGAQIDVVEFPNGLDAAEFREKSFHGSIQKQLANSLEYLQNSLIKEKIVKYSDRAEADRFYNYPYEALEEALANAVYHRDYELYEPIEVRVLPDAIRITSFGSTDPSVSIQDLEKGFVRVGRYRNRRVGEFLKELRLTEGRGTGLPTIKRALAANGSPEPIFDIGEPTREFFIIQIPIHSSFTTPSDQVTDQVSDQVTDQNIKYLMRAINLNDGVNDWVDVIIRYLQENAGQEKFNTKNLSMYKPLLSKLSEEQYKVLQYCQTANKRKDILERGLNITNHTANYQRHIEPLIMLELIKRTIPDKPQSQNQRYYTTEKGKIILYLKEQV